MLKICPLCYKFNLKLIFSKCTIGCFLFSFTFFFLNYGKPSPKSDLLCGKSVYRDFFVLFQCNRICDDFSVGFLNIFFQCHF